ncbi:MAG: DUF1963 domain-containing protein [Microscillaceae bacterium]|nr:DUF1963 domain-containing protein [Microscillaceae bacterium]MDW8460873.1 DUF1963 domain-containing protein [Cytophagales bacterium]
MKFRINFPVELQPFQPIFESTRKKFIKIINRPNQEVAPWQSKFAGMPFLPKGIDYPKDSKGRYLYLLAQINFEEVPQLDYLPHKGLLQFYIADDGLYGLDLDNSSEQQGFRVLFFPEIDKNDFQRDLPELPEPENSPFDNPFQAHRLEFSIEEEYASCSDLNLQYALGDRLQEFEDIIYQDDYRLADWLADNLSNWGNKLGGYAAFVQEDPRFEESIFKRFDTLLLQIGSTNGIMWGDMGIANFFINGEKLKKADFSDIMYNWDCG